MRVFRSMKNVKNMGKRNVLIPCGERVRPSDRLVSLVGQISAFRRTNQLVPSDRRVRFVGQIG